MSLEKYSICIGGLTKEWFDNQNLDDLHERFSENFSWTINSVLFDNDESNVIDEQSDELSTSEYTIIRMLVFGLSEIEYCLDTLSDSQIYMRRFPYSKTQITKANHLRRCIEMYLEEVYLLKLRLTNYVDKIVACKDISSVLPTSSFDQLDRAKSLATKSLKPIAGYGSIRGKHVHEERYSDPGIQRLSWLEGLANIADLDQKFRDLFLSVRDIEFIDVRRGWINRVQEETTAINKVIDLYFGLLVDSLFHEDDSPRFIFYSLGN